MSFFKKSKITSLLNCETESLKKNNNNKLTKTMKWVCTKMGLDKNNATSKGMKIISP